MEFRVTEDCKAVSLGWMVRRNRQHWWIAVVVILSLTTAISVIHFPELISLQKEQVSPELKLYLIGLSILILLFCVYVLQASARLQHVKEELVQKEIEKGKVQLLLEQVQEQSQQLLKTKEELETEISERKNTQEQLSYLAYHDGLTDLPNRTLFMDRLTQGLIRLAFHRRSAAVLFFDLDHFKHINDTLGHNIGDMLLKAVSERLKSCVREGDTVARLGGDEFAIMLADLARPEDVPLIAQKVTETLSQPFQIKDHQLFITTSIGISLYPSDCNDPEALLKAADLAMYRAKEQGRNNYQFYHPTLNTIAAERLSIETGLRQALEREEFLLHYQPLLDLATGHVIGIEALVRWRPPDGSLVSPAKFIPVAEETGLILSIGEWVLRTACRQTRAWQDAGFRNLRVSVNLSARQFHQKNLIQTIDKILKETGLDPRFLELELTESIMQNAQEIIETLHEINARGMEISVDDFGTGYSSLSYLKRLPIQTLKVDQSFVKNIAMGTDDMVIVISIINLAHNLGLKAIAEGVETAEQLQSLRWLNCDRMQGYLFSRPLPADEITKLLAEGRHL